MTILMNLSRYRPFIFLAFVLGFAVTASLILFHAFGYRYSFERGIFIYSGSVTISSLPQTVDIAIDGEALSPKHYGILNDTIHIPGLMPGEHQLTISAPDYLPWSKRITVQSGLSSEFWNIILTKKEYATEALPNTAESVRIYPHPNADIWALAKEHGHETSVVVYDRRNQTGREVFARNGTTFDFATEENFEWSPSGRKILLPLIESGTRSYVIVTSSDGTTEKLSDLVPGLTPSSARWNATSREELVFVAGHSLYRFDTTEERTPVLLAERVRAYEITNGYLYIATDDGMIARFRSTGDGRDRTDITAAASAQLGTLPYVLDVYDPERMALLEKSGSKRLFVYNKTPEKDYGFQQIAAGVERFQYSNDGKKLLFSSLYEIGVYFTRTWEVQPRRTENDTMQVARFSEPIANATWTEDYEHVLFTRGDTLKMIELDDRSGRAINDLHTFSEVPVQVFPLFSENILYIVVPHTDIASFTFPEPQGIFGQ